jgi:hypothetical protein
MGAKKAGKVRKYRLSLRNVIDPSNEKIRNEAVAELGKKIRITSWYVENNIHFKDITGYSQNYLIVMVRYKEIV